MFIKDIDDNRPESIRLFLQNTMGCAPVGSWKNSFLYRLRNNSTHHAVSVVVKMCIT